VLVEHGYDVLLYDVGSTDEAHRRILDTKLLSKRVDALLVLILPLTSHDVAALGKLHRPVVGVGPSVPGMSCVLIDDVEAGYIATRHLPQLGHRRIAFVGGDPADQFGFPVAPDRQLGYERALRSCAIPLDPCLSVPAAFTVDGGMDAANELVARPQRPTAVVAWSDEIAMGVLYACAVPGCAFRRPSRSSVSTTTTCRACSI
jgi:LacI family transcriptional regulator, repressor for deo operon, udp, cdd, tsx, nupC, and nupG